MQNQIRIDRNRVRDCFAAYTAAFDQADLQILNKIRHSWHVAANACSIASALGCNADLAWLIGVLHDIGRFEQIRRIHGYDDSRGLDHGDYGAKVLFEEGLIRQFTSDDTADEIIRKAVRYHNKYELPPDLGGEELLYCQLIRDADKIDNFRGFLENDFYSFHERTPEEVQSSLISDEVLECFARHRTIPFAKIRTAADFFLIPYALYFGLVFPASRQLVKQQGNFVRMLDFRFRLPENAVRFAAVRKELEAYQKRCENMEKEFCNG